MGEVLILHSTQNILAKTLVELVEALHLCSVKGQVVVCQACLSTHHYQLSWEVRHHVGKEAICHLVPPFDFLLSTILQLVAQAHSQGIHRTHFFDLEVFDFTVKDILRLGQFTRNLAVSHKLDCQAIANSTTDQVSQRVVVNVIVLKQPRSTIITS